MRIGVSLPQVGRLADPAAVRAAAVAAEQVGYSSVWVLDRLLAPMAPRSADPTSSDGRLPPEQGTVLDPLGVLGLAAAVTDRVRIGTSVLVAPWYPPLLLARALTTLDLVSSGRLVVGLGLGWSIDEFEAAGVPRRVLAAKLEETLDVLAAAWGDGPVDYVGDRVRIARAEVRPKPAQRPGPPVLLAGTTPAGLDRVARRADGWMPTGLPIELLAPMWSTVRNRAAEHGRDADRLSLVVRAAVSLTGRPLDAGRSAYHGTVEQVAADLAATGDAGAHEVILAVAGDPTLDEALDHYARLAEALDELRVA